MNYSSRKIALFDGTGNVSLGADKVTLYTTTETRESVKNLHFSTYPPYFYVTTPTKKRTILNAFNIINIK